jgi:hypothetical protein
MKKLVIMACAVAMTAVAQAASVNWGSGAFYTASGKDGGWSSTMVNAAGATVTMSIYLVDAATYATVSAMDQAGMYKWASGQTATYTGQNKNPSTGALIPAVTIGTDDLGKSTTYYSILTAEYKDATNGEMYMAAAKEFTTSGTGQANNSNIFGGAATAATGGVRDWQAAAVPEPTSGLLLLLGVAGLALRRKQK